MHQTAPARPSGDWLGGCVNTEKVIKGQPLNNMVWSAQAQLLHIRTDLFKKHGVKVPTTMAELEDAAKKLMIDEDGDGKPEIYGFLSRGHGRLTTASFVSYLFNFGGSWFRTNADGTRTANLNSKESVDAFEFYGRMIRNYAPKSALNNKPPQNAALYAAGKVAMLSALNFWHSLANDPKKSRIAGNTTTIMVLAGSAGSFPNLPTTSLAIPLMHSPVIRVAAPLEELNPRLPTTSPALQLYIAWPPDLQKRIPRRATAPAAATRRVAEVSADESCNGHSLPW